MVFAKLIYEGEAVWGIEEGKYFRILDNAPWEDWRYTGKEVRSARAKLCAPITNRLYVIHDGNNKLTYKNAVHVSGSGSSLICPNEGLELFYGYAIIFGHEEKVQGYTLYCGGAVGPYLAEYLPKDKFVLQIGKEKKELPIYETEQAWKEVLHENKLVAGDAVVFAASTQMVLHIGEDAALTTSNLGALKITGIAHQMQGKRAL